jgi:tetratricopeptide (TPR) repeat protein
VNRSTRLIPYLIAAATLVVYGNLCRHEFTFWDDNFNVWQNPRLNPPTFASVSWYWTHQANGLYVPLTYTVWALLAHVAYVNQPNELGAHLNPYVFHSASVLLHVASGLAVYAVVRRVVRNEWAACAGAMVFALHPVQVEAVAWVAGLKDVMCGCLSMLALWAYLGSVDEPRPPMRRTTYLIATAALILAMLAKPTAMVVPFIALVLHVWGIGRPAREASARLAPWFALSIACAVVAKLAQPAHGVPAIPLWARCFLAGDALAFYLYKLVFPASLGIDYGWRPTAIVQRWWFYVLWIVPTAALALLLLNRKRNSLLFAAGAIFALGVAPVLGFSTFLFQFFSTVADHYLYISMVGVALAVASLLAHTSKASARILAAVAIVALGARSIVQTQVWHDDFTLFGNAIRVNPRSFVARNNLAHALRLYGRLDEAERALREAIELKPDYWEARQNLADIYFMTGRAPQGVEQVKRSIDVKAKLPPQLGFDVVEDHVKLGDTLMSIGWYDDAAEQYRTALRLRPLYPTARRKLEEAEANLRTTPTRPTTTTAPS